ncbi:hypothetical protein HPB50_017178 [Hyalomma asiaticum]|uniref:Uncharacterized protein n=1 Tax=Hyalomma asiaticum TaxID=266040 RepID=A0ACB7TLN1_HYAAI|nr:hypothetical protein HPB50_017178 [Hyalomma asiaticum]
MSRFCRWPDRLRLVPAAGAAERGGRAPRWSPWSEHHAAPPAAEGWGEEAGSRTSGRTCCVAGSPGLSGTEREAPLLAAFVLDVRRPGPI